jgi:Pentapeptide repeats (8 copies)
MRRVLLAIFLVNALSTGFLWVESSHACDGPYKDGSKPTEEALTKILKDHREWLSSGTPWMRPNLRDQRRAILCKADLRGAHLSGAKLRWANLQEANLQGAFLTGTQLQEAGLSEAQLQGAYLWDVNLQKAFLDRAQLQGAFLNNVQLQGASLIGTQLQGADLFNVDLAEAIFEVQPGSLPSITSLVDAKTLAKMTFLYSPHALVELREAFKKEGMRTEERQLTYAIEHTKMLRAWNPWWKLEWSSDASDDPRPWLEWFFGKSESLFSYVLFELPCDYGMSPGRPLKILASFIGLFSLVYMVALLTARERAGIWMIWLPDRVHRTEGETNPVRVTSTFWLSSLQMRAAGYWWRGLLRGLSVLLIGLYFSLLSAFSLGWREFNVGTWIARVQPSEYTLRATGWVRTVSGVQALLSVYLLALWVLAYFGRPFE